jgi:SAM-dependent methyltransferase
MNFLWGLEAMQNDLRLILARSISIFSMGKRRRSKSTLKSMSRNMDQSMHSYDPGMFNRQDADIVVPMIMELSTVASVVDVGCGIGSWLAAFADFGIEDYLGLDGDHVPIDKLMVEPEHFLSCNLESPPEIDRKFDLCLSLEVAEHLHEGSADHFVEFLVSLSDIVVFSAAIPGQTGQNHHNLQWPEYWAEKFRDYGYACYDPIRPRIWEDSRVKWWYQQNMILFARSSAQLDLESVVPLRRIHPKQYM